MKIVLAAGIFPPDIGGPARYAQMIADGLPAEGIEVVVVPYHTVRTVPKIFRHLAYTWRLWRASSGSDLVYTLDPVSVGVPAAIVAFLTGRPLVVRLGGDYAWEQGVQRFGLITTLDEYTADRRQAPWRVRLLAYIEEVVVRRAVAVILPSQYLRSIVATWGIAPERLQVIYSAHTVTIDTAHSDKSVLPPSDTPRFLSIARLTPWKGMHTLIALMARRKAALLPGTLYIGGDGPERARLEEQVRVNQLETQVRFLGALSFGDVFTAVREADVFLLDTAYEGLSHQLLEVMALGTPIVTTPVGGNSELLTDGVEALLVPVGDVAGYDNAVNRLLADSTLRDRLIAAAQAKATTFASVDAVPLIAQLLRRVVSSKD